MRTVRLASLFAACAALLPAQNPCEGNGFGSAYITTTPAIAGGSLVMNIGSPATPNGIGLLAFGVGAGPQFAFCHDIIAFIGLLAVLDGSGNAQFTFPIAPASFGATLYARSVTLENNNFSLSKVVRVEVEFANSTRSVASLANARSLHTCTAFGTGPQDNRTGAIVIGGATGSMIHPISMATTEVFDTLSRTWSPGPTMFVSRASHAAVRLLDGRILIAGGMVNAGGSVGGPATAFCEIYSPATNTLALTGSMLQPRMGHAMTVLPDGRVLASGGFADWTNITTGPQFEVCLDTAQDTTELWDPVSGAWSAGPTMASKRAGHSQTLLPNNRVLIASGIDGGVQLLASGLQLIWVPTFTQSCELFSPGNNTLISVAAIPLARAFHGATLRPNLSVLMTGGAAAIGFYGEAVGTNSCLLFDVANTSWITAASLPTGVAFHTQSPLSTGAALVTGGYTGNFATLAATDEVVSHNGAAPTVLAALGENPAFPGALHHFAGAHTATLLHDGTTLITGGYGGLPATTFANAMLFIAP